MAIEINNSNFSREVKDSKVPVLIDFWAPWCGPCRMMAPVFDELSKSKDFEGKLKFGKVNVDENPELANQFGIQGIPCLILAKNGKEADRIVGFSSKEVLLSKIKMMVK